MPNIKTTPSGAYPSIPDVGDTLESHGAAIQAIADSLQTAITRGQDYLESFVTFQELVTLGIIDERGEFVLSLGDVDIGVLNSITDVTITGTPANNEVLAYDTGSGDWINQTAAEAGLLTGSHTHTESEITDLQPYLINISGQLFGSLDDVVLADPPLNREFLVFDLATGHWINQTSTELGISGVNPGTVVDAVLRWSGSEWVESTNVLFSAVGKITAPSYDDINVRLGKDLRIYETADVKNAHFYYNGDFNTDISGVGDNWDIRPGNGGRVRIRGANSGFQLRDGGLFTVWSPDDTKFMQISVADTTGTALISATTIRMPGVVRIEGNGLGDFGDFSHDGTDFLTDFTNTGVWNITGALLRLDGEVIMKERAAAPVGESNYGVIWVKNTVPNELWFTNDASQDFMLVSDLVSDASPQLGGNLASNGFDILMADNDKVIFGDGGDMQLYNIGGTATSVIANLNANAVLEFNFTGGQIKFDGLNDILDIHDGWTLRIRDGTDLDWGDFSHDGTDFNTAFTNTTDWNITGVSAIRLAGVALATLNTNWSAADITSGVLAVLRGGTGVTTKTGTGSVVLHTSPTLTGLVSFTQIQAPTTSTRDKIRVYPSSSYCIGMGSGYTFGGISNSYVMSFQMNDDATRGFWWGDTVHTNAQGAMALTTGVIKKTPDGRDVISYKFIPVREQ